MNAMARLAAQEGARVSAQWGDANRSQGAHKEKTAAYLVAEFAEQKGIKLRDLLAWDHKAWNPMSAHRNECWAMLRDKTALSYPQIGRMFSGRDHSTIMTGVKKHRAKGGS